MPTAASYAVARVIALPNIVLPLPVVAELLFGAENSARFLQNLTRYSELVLWLQWGEKPLHSMPKHAFP